MNLRERFLLGSASTFSPPFGASTTTTGFLGGVEAPRKPAAAMAAAIDQARTVGRMRRVTPPPVSRVQDVVGEVEDDVGLGVHQNQPRADEPVLELADQLWKPFQDLRRHGRKRHARRVLLVD